METKERGRPQQTQTQTQTNGDDLPQECWELILKKLITSSTINHTEPLSLVSMRLLTLSNCLRHSLTLSTRSLPFLHRLLLRFPNLHHLTVDPSVSGDLLDYLLNHLSLSGLSLHSLTISDQSRFPNLGLADFALKVRTLTKLVSGRVSGLNDRDLGIIANSFPFLEELDISYPDYDLRFSFNGSLESSSSSGFVSDAGILDLSLKLGMLKRIDLSGNHFITDKSVSSLASHCTQLVEVLFCDCDFVSQRGLGYALRNCANLKVVFIDGVGIPRVDSYLSDSFAYARNLCEISFSGSLMSDDMLRLVADVCLPLKKLTVSRCYGFTFTGIYLLLSKYRSLEYLDLEGTNFLSDQCMIELSEFMRELTFINLSCCSKLTNLTFFALIRSCTGLEDIVIEGTNLGVEEYLTDLVVNPRFKLLNCSECINLSDEFIKNVVLCCPNIEVLKISHCPAITGMGLREVLKSCCRIRHLEINQCVGIDSLHIDCELPNLEVLQAKGPGIDDEALVNVGKICPGLLYLDLEGSYYITAKGVNEVVKNCLRLREINLKLCMNVKIDIVTSMVFTRPSLRKIVPPCRFIPTDRQTEFFLQHGCLVCKG